MTIPHPENEALENSGGYASTTHEASSPQLYTPRQAPRGTPAHTRLFSRYDIHVRPPHHR